ncbi:hypothetical protein KA344_01785 [bacterium]|jgi:hypothetical protein|nr:hypothetical protein [bacterium]
MTPLSNLSQYSPGELEAVIHHELKALCLCTYYPTLDNNVGTPALPVKLKLPSRRSFGRLSGINGTVWLFRYDNSYTIVCDAPVLQNKLEALVLLSDNDISVSTPIKDDATAPLLVKFSSHESLTLAVTVLRQAVNAMITAAT